MSSLPNCRYGTSCKDVKVNNCQFWHPRCVHGMNCKYLPNQNCGFYHTNREHQLSSIPSPPKRQFQHMNNFGNRNQIHHQNKYQNQLNHRQKLKERRESHIKAISRNQQSKQLQFPKINRAPDFNLQLTDPDEFYSVFQPESFAEGACRYAYAGLMNRNDYEHNRKRGDKVVIKKWKNHHVFEEKFWDRDIKCYKEAEYLINIWNTMKITHAYYDLCIPTKQICSESSGNSNTDVVLDEWIITEDYLPGQFIKWNSNSGFVHDKEMSIHAFCHWTFHHSKGDYVMCDAQGTISGQLYRITDPCICSENQRFGATDLGQRGIMSFFANHECNDFCRNWMKPNIDPTLLLLKRQTSTYRWDIPNQNFGGVLPGLTVVRD